MAMRKIVLLMIICVFAIGTRGEGIRFFKGSFQDALKQARAENKKVWTLSTDVQEYIPG